MNLRLMTDGTRRPRHSCLFELACQPSKRIFSLLAEVMTNYLRSEGLSEACLSKKKKKIPAIECGLISQVAKVLPASTSVQVQILANLINDRKLNKLIKHICTSFLPTTALEERQSETLSLAEYKAQ